MVMIAKGCTPTLGIIAMMPIEKRFRQGRVISLIWLHGVEVCNGTLVFFRLGEWIKPNDIRKLIDDALEIHQALLPQ
tara:strand:+ start:144 stop:374 length:231 start_codon:yes stop_codon:yes gene_type:complete